MGFLDNTGLSYFFEKIKDIFTRSVNGAKPDNNGDIQITNVTVADNLIGSDNQFSADQFAYRNSGGNTTITSNKGQLVYLDGAVQISSGNIATIAKPSKIVSTGFNSFNAADGNMYISDATISNGTIISSTGNYVGFCRAVGKIPNGYVAYSSGGGITGIGWSSALPSLGASVSTASASVTASLASISFESNGYIAVAISSNNLTELCIHPKLDGSADTVFKAYTSASEIALPTADINGTALPTYGMPAVDGVRDRFDFKNNTYIKKIERIEKSSPQAIIYASGPHIDDGTYIYYIRETPIVYDVNLSSKYVVNNFGTEEIVGNGIPMKTQILYGENLQEKLESGVLTTSASYADIGLASNQVRQIFISNSAPTSATLPSDAIWFKYS